MEVVIRLFRWVTRGKRRLNNSSGAVESPTNASKCSAMSHLQEYLNYYTTLTAPGYAVLVTGDWGSGKTYQVKSYLREEDRLYVSLFGVQTVEQLHSEVFAAADPTLAKAEKLVGRSSNLVAGMSGPWALANAIPSVFSAIFKREIEPTKTLVFDDLERSDLELKDVLGAINSYVEHLGFRVVVIAHDEKLADEFLQMKEKTFGQSIRIEPQVEDALAHFLREIGSPSAKEFASDYKLQIYDTFIRSGVKSLRVLRHVVEDLTRLHGALRSDHLENREAMDELTKTFVAFQIEVRDGNLKSNDLCNRRGVRRGYLYRAVGNTQNPPDAPPLVTADDKYPEIDLETGMLNDFVLVSMLIHGRFHKEDICASIDNSSYFIVPSDVPPWKVVIHFDEMEDEAVDTASKRMQEQLEKYEVTESGEMLHIFSLRIMMAENGIIDHSIETVVSESKAYIDQLLKDGRLPARETDWQWYDNFKGAHDGVGYWVSEKTSHHFQEIWDHLISCREKAFQQKIPDILDDLLDMVSKDSKAFFEAVSSTNNGPNPYAMVPLLHGVAPEKFVEVWLSADRSNWRNVKYALENRYSFNQLERDLSPERDWALKVLKELDKRAREEAGFRALRINRIRPKVLLELAQAVEDVEAEAVPVEIQKA